MSLICLFAPLRKESSPSVFSPAGGNLWDGDSGAGNVSAAGTKAGRGPGGRGLPLPRAFIGS